VAALAASLLGIMAGVSGLEPREQEPDPPAAAAREPAPAPAVSPGLVLEPAGPGPGQGRHIVFLAGDEEYRSEEALPLLASILAGRHGFRCTVLFSLDPETGEIDPDEQTWMPGLEALEEADLCVVFLRFREWPDEQMAHFVRYVGSGRPLVGLRTATHAFDYRRRPESPYARWSWDSREWPGGFGRQVLGETWVAHHGVHGRESTRGVPDAAARRHPILRGVGPGVWGPTDVYAVRDLPAGTTVVLRGLVLQGMDPGDPPVEDGRNDPPMPLLWTRTWTSPGGPARVVCSTLGAARDLAAEDSRRLLVNAIYWALGLEDRIPETADVRPLAPFEPSPFGFGRWRRGLRPADLGAALQGAETGGGGG